MLAKERFLSISEKEFILEALRAGRRIDGRGIHDFRTIKIAFGEQRGQAEVQLGQTRVMTVVSAELMEPFPDRPAEGFFLFNTEFSPMASPTFEIGR
jgi:exosome complex component RRP45